MPALPFAARPAVIGMIHLPALPGAPGFAGDLGACARQAAEDAAVLASAGVDGIMIENFHDAPFFKDRLPPATIAALTRCAWAAREAAPDTPLGVNALRNAGPAALAIAVAVDAAFIRVNVLIGAMVTDQGVIEGCAAELMRLRATLGPQIAVMADIAVKHAQPLGGLDLVQAARDTVRRARADALIVSGSGTGAPTDPARVAAVKAAVPEAPVYVGSGTTVDSLATLGADGYIVGTALKRAGRVDAERTRAIMQAARA